MDISAIQTGVKAVAESSSQIPHEQVKSSAMDHATRERRAASAEDAQKVIDTLQKNSAEDIEYKMNSDHGRYSIDIVDETDKVIATIPYRKVDELAQMIRELGSKGDDRSKGMVVDAYVD